MSHFRVQETDQIVVRAEIISPTAQAFGRWHHVNISYIDAIQEDPFCDSDVEVSIRSTLCSLTIIPLEKQYEIHEYT